MVIGVACGTKFSSLCTCLMQNAVYYYFVLYPRPQLSRLPLFDMFIYASKPSCTWARESNTNSTITKTGFAEDYSRILRLFQICLGDDIIPPTSHCHS